MTSNSSYLVQILPKQSGNGQCIGKEWFDGFLQELTDKFGGATSFLRSPGQGLWQSGGGTEKDSIAVIEVMVERLDRVFWRSLVWHIRCVKLIDGSSVRFIKNLAWDTSICAPLMGQRNRAGRGVTAQGRRPDFELPETSS